MPATDTARKKPASQSIMVERHEAKYVIPRSIVPAIREFIRPFCTPDPNGEGDPPEYVVTTLQLDSPDLVLHHAKEYDALNRFKLRVRTYGTENTAPVYAEIKRKIKGVIVKSRACIPRDKWCADLILNPNHRIDIHFRSAAEDVAFLEFIRLTREIGARPTVALCYTRESHISTVDQYARVTFDRKLMYQATTSWTSFGKNGIWRPLDSSLAQNKQYRFSGVVLELKTLSDVPHWIIELVKEFDLVRTGHCKYSNAVWVESLFRGTPHVPTYAIELLGC
jgi:hypothetical protein